MANDPNRIILPRDTEGEFKEFEDFWNDDGELRDYFFPQPTNISAAYFNNAFQLSMQCTPWTRRRSRWDLKLHFKKCRGMTVMRRILETVQKWTKKHEPGKRYPEKVTTIETDISPMYKDQYDVIMLGIPGEQIEMVVDTILKMLKEAFD